MVVVVIVVVCDDKLGDMRILLKKKKKKKNHSRSNRIRNKREARTKTTEIATLSCLAGRICATFDPRPTPKKKEKMGKKVWS